MYAGLLAVCLVAVACAAPSVETNRAPFRLRFDPYEETWKQFKQDHGKEYATEMEEENRRRIFMDSVRVMEQHNWLYFKGETSYYMGINQFADMTPEEYAQYNRLLNKTAAAGKGIKKCSQFSPPLNWVLPSEVDWRTKGYVTPVKDQGQCGSCWAFSTTGSLEGQHFRKTGKLVSLSEQQLVDCSGKFGNLGCGGGLMDHAFEYINSVGGLESEKEYPYKAKNDKCKFVKSEAVADLSSCQDIEDASEKALQEAVASVGPISVAIDANHDSFMHYKGGVYDEPMCSGVDLDHGVLVVGYGSENGQDYWLVKNSWSTKWGDKGYIKMSRNKHNQCGIATAASFPVV